VTRKDDAVGKLKPVPDCANEAEERAFWQSHGTSDYVDWTKAEHVRFPNLKPSTRSVSLRLPQALLDDLKTAANRRDVPYQSLIKVWLAERLAEESKPRANGR
jgi:predicted DNA binding CopG/RHH family protein